LKLSLNMRLRFSIVLLLAPAVFSAAQTKRALLIGIDTYQPAGTSAQHPPGCAYGRCELGSFENLEGSVNDAQSMADLLTSPKFGFPAGNVAMLTNPAPPQPRPGLVVLPPAQTDRDGILAAMQKYLVDLPRRGDAVVFYDASHGSLRVNSQGSKLTVLLNDKYVHVDSTLVPADSYKGGFDVRDREMTRIFNAALDKGVRLTVIFDSCHSGGATRGGGAKYRTRSLPFDERDANEAPELLPNGLPRPPPTERQDNPAIVFSAAQQDQEANESEPTPARPEAHGAFTAALLEALQALPVNAPASLVYQRVKAVLESDSIANQEPDLDATTDRRQQPLFGGVADPDPAKMRAAVLKTGKDGTVWLDAGRVSGLGIGSEFASMVPNHDGQTVRLSITNLEGISRSSARIVSPAGAKVEDGEIFELAKWIPADSASLRFWLWPSNLSEDEILAAVEQIKSADVTLIADPAEDPWTDRLSWDGASWTLQHANVSPEGIHSGGKDIEAKPMAPVPLGAKFTSATLKQNLSPNAKLWVNLPPSRAMAAKLQPHESNSAVQAAPDLAAANYLLTGTLGTHGPAYAWFHKQEFDAGPPAKPSSGHSPGCSTASQYPVRSDWVPVANPARLDDSVASLNKYASLLAKVHGWLQLADNPAGASMANYYKLAVLRAADQTTLSPDQPAAQDDRVLIALASQTQVTERRWVYVLDIDCHGKGTLLYPIDYSENQFPNDADRARQFLLPGARPLVIGPPYGVDTLILLSTAQPLPDPSVLNFEGVVVQQNRGSKSPLEQLLTDTSSGTRGQYPAVPTNWGIDLTTLRSVPKAQ
jgi:Caspase domain